MLKEIMKISDILEVPKHGLVLLGSNPIFDSLSKAQIFEIIGNHIIVVSQDGTNIEFDVENIDAPASLIGKRNIEICIGRPIDKSRLTTDSRVYVRVEG